MTGDTRLTADQLLTQRELDSIRLAQDVYGARAKEGALALSEALGFDEVARDRFIGAVAVGLEGLDFEERRTIALRFQELSDAFGSTAVKAVSSVAGNTIGGAESTQHHVEAAKGAIPTADKRGHSSSNGAATVEPEGLVEAPETAIKPENEHQPQSTAKRAMASAAEGFVNTEIDTVSSGGEKETEDELDFGNLSKKQFEWLAQFLDDSTIEDISQLSTEARRGFANALAEKYLTYKVQRLDSAGKQKRSQIIRAFLGSQTLEEVAATFDMKGTWPLTDALKRIARNIKSNMTTSEVIELLPSASELPITDVDDITADTSEDQRTTAELNELQRSWYRKIFEDESTIDLIATLTVEQVDYLAGQLGNFLSSAIARKQGSFKTARHVKELKLLIGGMDYEAIGRETGTYVAVVKQELHYSAQRLGATIPEQTLKATVKDATLYQDK